MAKLEIPVRFETRLCAVNGKLGYFHCWEHYSNPIPGSLLRGGAPAGVVSFVRALVEFPEGMGYSSPADIKFCDEQNAILCAMDKHYKDERWRSEPGTPKFRKRWKSKS